MKEKIAVFMDQEWTLPEKLLILSTAALSGILIGFLLAPARKKIWHCGNDNGSYNACDPACKDKEK